MKMVPAVIRPERFRKEKPARGSDGKIPVLPADRVFRVRVQEKWD
jgi:hypothetical protein